MRNHSGNVVIVGGGAGGLELAVRLAKNGQNGVLLIDRNDTHIWKPRIHELAAGLRRGYVDELGYAGLAEHWGFAFERGELCDVDTDTRHITLSEVRGRDGEKLIEKRNIAYKALVLALGGVTPDMGVDGVSDHAFLLDSEEDAEILSRHFSSGLLAHSFSDHNQPYHLVIVGSGATGVELGALLATDAVGASLAPRSSQPEVRITILEASDTFAPGIDDKVRRAITGRLKNAGINIKTGQQVNRSKEFPRERLRPRAANNIRRISLCGLPGVSARLSPVALIVYRAIKNGNGEWVAHYKALIQRLYLLWGTAPSLTTIPRHQQPRQQVNRLSISLPK